MLDAQCPSDHHNSEVRAECGTSSSQHSSKSSVSVAAVEARARAEAARAKANYAKRQIDVEVEKARIDMEKTRIHATLNALKEEAYNSTRADGPSHVSTSRPSDVSDLAAYLARRDLVLSGLKTFDNRPENYLSWKAGFHNAIEGLNLKPSEQLELLIKWLGGESLQHAKRIRAVQVNYPTTGLNMVWQRLDRSYGSPEAIEASLFARLDNFQWIQNKDYQWLQELADLLFEVESAKWEGYLPGLNFLDTARGVNPIVEKLPHNLQEQWVIRGSKYKKEHQTPYPPFSFFVEFVHDHAEMRTDPSFIYQASSAVSLRGERPPEKQWKTKNPICVNKTEVRSSSFPDPKNKYHEDPDKQCPIHKRPHSLKKCRSFREKPLEERKGFLKEHFICFKCCASTTHQAKDCRVDIPCSECDSDRHISAFHAGPPTWSAKGPTTPAAEHGREQIEQASEVVT
ncbi:hypothetical protein SKAU_G00063760 [Synaphobranchus kaupii]|uniref:Uncharacterized protein n=1 Tax=Synaphobranchus kaupii TaxID=118154 RepID=A0A9Q1J9V4_SYNKA|nr:hypothetical protein SKAU_G00063760 [Synaphobranchus kaupii]